MILAVVIALLNYVTLSFFLDYVGLIFDIDVDIASLNPNSQFHKLFNDEAYTLYPILAKMHSPHRLFALRYIVANFTLAFILYIVNFYIYGRLNISINKLIILSVVSTMIITTIFCTISVYADIYIRTINGYLIGDSRMSEVVHSAIMRDSIVSVIVVFSTISMHHTKQQEKSRLENEALIAENMRSRYNALTAKLDPHFLFNSLNTLKALIKSAPSKAQEYTQQLSDIFRYTINHKEIITLGEEMEFSQAYGNMMLTRYENSLSIMYNVEDRYLSYEIVPFCIQTLIENAIKHNTITTKKPLVIEIYSDEENHIIVKNRKAPKRVKEISNGLGLKNLNDRYKYQFKKEIEIFNTDEEFIVKVPIIKMKEESV